MAQTVVPIGQISHATVSAASAWNAIADESSFVKVNVALPAASPSKNNPTHATGLRKAANCQTWSFQGVLIASIQLMAEESARSCTALVQKLQGFPCTAADPIRNLQDDDHVNKPEVLVQTMQ